MRIKYPNYQHCLTNLSASILKYYGCKANKPTLKELDNKLLKEYHHLFVILIDGMGSELLKKMPSNSFFNSNRIATISSVFPPTTVAATTALISGQEPIENGWFGWTQYFKEYDNNFIMFRNMTDKEEKVDIDIYNKVLPFPSIFQEIQNTGIHFAEIFPSFRTGGYENFNHLKELIINTNKISSKAIFYVYIHDYDYNMHDFGPSDERATAVLYEIENTLKQGFEELTNNSAFIITADHGHIDVEEINLLDYPDIVATFKHRPSFEMRALNFFIKEDKSEEFKTLFNKYFKDYYLLFSKEECLKRNLFGLSNCSKYHYFIGDFVACAISNKVFNISEEKGFKGNHAGLTEEEMDIPLIFVKK